jgi:hypothetical protein
MNRLVSAWEELLRQATSPDYDEFQDAMFRIALVLERHNYPNRSIGDIYEEYLSRDLLRLALDDRRQREAVDFLVAMVRARRADADTFLYALARVKPVLMVEPLLGLIHEWHDKWPLDACYEAACGLDMALKVGGDEVMTAFQAHDPSEILDGWADSADDSLAERAGLVLAKLDRLLGGEA